MQSSRRILKEEITENDIANIVAKWTNIPVSRMLEEEAQKLTRMEDDLKKRIVGQGEAVKKLPILSNDLGPALPTPINQSVLSYFWDRREWVKLN